MIISANQLLYGKRQRGQRPETSEQWINHYRHLHFDLVETIETLSDLCAQFDISEPLDQMMRREVQVNFRGDEEAIINITSIDSPGLHLTIEQNQSGPELGIYQHQLTTDDLHHRLSKSLYIPSKNEQHASQAEALLRPQLSGLGFRAMRISLDGQEILARISSGEEMEIIPQDDQWPEINYLAPAAGCHEIVNLAQETETVSREEGRRLHDLIWDLPYTENVLAALAADDMGIAVVSTLKDVEVRSKIS